MTTTITKEKRKTMIDSEYKAVVQRLVDAIINSKYILREAVQAELEQNLNKINFENVVKVLSRYGEIAQNKELDGKHIAVICKGDPEMTIQILLAALRNNIHIKLVTLNYHIINNCIFTLFSEVMQDIKLPNIYLNYNENYFEQDIIEKNQSFDKIIYIGDYFDYQNFEYFCSNENLVFWNDNNIKVLMSRADYKEEYKEMVKFAYTNNIELEVYDYEEDFFDEVEEGEFAIIYTKENEEKFLEKINPRILKFNEFNFEDFKFKVNDLILGLDFSVKV